MKNVRSIRFGALVAIGFVLANAAASEFSTTSLQGGWTGTATGPIYDNAGNIIGTQTTPVAFICDATGLIPDGTNLSFLEVDSAGTVLAQLLHRTAPFLAFQILPSQNAKLTRPGVNGAPYRIVAQPDAYSPYSLDISGGVNDAPIPNRTQYSLLGHWKGQYYFYGVEAAVFPTPPIPTLDFDVDSAGRISGNGFSGALHLDSSGLVGGSVSYGPIGTLSFQQLHLMSPGDNGAPYKLISPFQPISGYNFIISGGTEPRAPSITSVDNVAGFTDVPFRFDIAADGIPPPSISVSGLPAGFSLNGNSIIGIASSTGSATVVVTATNVIGAVTQTLTMNFSPPPPPLITSPDRLTGFAAIPLSFDIAVASVAAVTVDVSGLPAGLFFNGRSVIGTPLAPGSSMATVTATNVSGTVTQQLAVDIAPTPPPTFDIAATISALMGDPFSVDLVARGVNPIQIVTGPLPGGVTVSGARLSGVIDTPGTYNVDISATNIGGVTTMTLKIVIVQIPPPVFTSTSSVRLWTNQLMRTTLFATGMPSITYSTGALPGTIVLQGSLLVGSVGTAGTYTIDTVATNRGGSTHQALTLIVSVPPDAIPAPPIPQPPLIPPAEQPSFTSPLQASAVSVSPGEVVKFTSAASPNDGSISYVWNFGDGAILNGADGIEHTYAAPGTYIVTLKIVNSAGSAVSDALTVTVGPYHINLGTISRKKTHGRVRLTIRPPADVSRRLAPKAKVSSSNLAPALKYSRLVITGKVSANGHYAIDLIYPGSQETLISYSFDIVD
jgi:hypothetical protein